MGGRRHCDNGSSGAVMARGSRSPDDGKSPSSRLSHRGASRAEQGEGKLHGVLWVIMTATQGGRWLEGVAGRPRRRLRGWRGPSLGGGGAGDRGLTRSSLGPHLKGPVPIFLHPSGLLAFALQREHKAAAATGEQWPPSYCLSYGASRTAQKERVKKMVARYDRGRGAGWLQWPRGVARGAVGWSQRLRFFAASRGHCNGFGSLPRSGRHTGWAPIASCVRRGGCSVLDVTKCRNGDYIHRVGRTARAGRTGLAISLVNQYEVEWYLLIEKLIGKKLPEYPAEEEEVMQLLESVTDARRMAHMEMKDDPGYKRKRRGREGDDETDEHFISLKNGKKSKKSKRR
ncbi:hypothetical protein Taro_006256 [Colocasia esculenta]|uniref:Uncharacterized protein n=1 Tax=Colocasia esculenta TaxID=4460 RepID=A0A843TX55_COLES|nr:hypothetical protein [Colocasia esculenta]